jgi:hypothetical protein
LIKKGGTIGITLHYAAALSEKKLNQLMDYWKEQVPKLKKQFPSKDYFPYGGFHIVKRFEKIRDANEDEKRYHTLVNPEKGFTREDLFNAVYAHPLLIDGKTPKSKIKETRYMKGIEIYPNVGSEAIEFVAAKQNGKWILKGFTKTQYGGIPAHLIAGNILEETKRRFLPKMTIHDEAEYFGTGGKHDPELLKRNFEESAIMIDKIAEMLGKAGFKHDQIQTGGEIALREKKKLEGVV